MPIERIVLNASPVIVLFKARLEHILPDLFKDIVIPKNVLDEISSVNDRAAREIQKLKWYDVHKIKIDTNILEWNLGKGESSVLSFALKNKQYRAVLDDMAARKCARTLYGKKSDKLEEFNLKAWKPGGRRGPRGSQTVE